MTTHKQCEIYSNFSKMPYMNWAIKYQCLLLFHELEDKAPVSQLNGGDMDMAESIM
jgi:hypothetical protein